MAYSLAKSLRATAAEHLEFTGDDNIGFTWVGNVDKSGDWKKTYRGDLAMTGKENPYGSVQLGGTNYQRRRTDTSDDNDDESDYGNRRGNRLGATCGSSHEGPYGVSKRQGNPDILGATNTSSGWRSSGRNPYDNRLPMETSDRQQLGSTNIIPSFDKQNFRKTKFGSSGQNLRVTRNPYGITQLSILPEESERGPPAGSRPYDDTYPTELGGIATGAYDRKDGWKTMLANRNITDQIYRQFDQIKRRWAPSSGLSETGSVKKWDEQSTDTSSSTETRSGCFSDSDDYDHKSLKKRCLVGFIILFVILVLAAAIVPAVVLTLKKDSGDSPDVMERIDMQAKINNFNFTPGLNDNTSDEYYNFTHTFCDEINATMAENNKADGLVKDLFGCTVQSLSSGSVIVKFTVVIIHGGNNGPPTETQVKILVGVGDGNTGTVSIGIFTIDVETFVVQAVVVVTAENNPLPTVISYDGICQPKDECETSLARCLDGKCACAQNRYYNSVNDSCLKVDCGQKPTVTHGATATSEGSLYGSILKVTCDEGYALPSDQDPFNVTCVNNNSWANLPGCSPISCGNYTAQIDSHILGYDPNSFIGSVFNENVTILCVDGYENPAEKTETCQSDGKWTSNVRCTAVSCGSFQAPDHSVIFENGIEYENTVNITCNPGYEIEGESSSTCQANRNWTSYGKCNPILCKTFEVVQNSKNTSIVNDIRFNEPIIILCQDDHVYVGDTSLSCDENGDWPNISCVPVACSGTTNIDNGKISNASETTLIYQCNDGYETDDNIIVECLNDQWDSLPVCTRKDCGKIATLMNGNITYVDGTFFGDTAVVECDIGYELSQEDIIQCQSNGTWNYLPFCDKVYCDTFPPNAVNSSSTGYGFGDRVEITCEKGYRVIENISECQSNKRWVPDSVCQIKDCGNISIENGQIQDEANTTFGSVIFVACEDGLSIIGKEHVSCLETGEWDALPICVQSDCGNLTLPEQAYANGSIVECTDGYTLKGNSDIKCHSNGSWEPVGDCNPVSCNATDAPSNGDIKNKTSSHVFQTKLTVMCNEGYQLNGSETIECLSSGKWSVIAECPPVTCLPFTLPNNSNFIEVNDQSKNTYMSNFTIKCLNGYEMKGNANVTCQSNGTWTISPECVPVMCKNYTVPPNAHIAEGESPANYFNESITVMCDLGYDYADSALTTDVCQSNKNWTTQVSCEPVSCGAFGETIEYAEMSQDGSNYGDNITVTCNTGYVLKGAEIIQCAENRSWSSAPTCEPINCTQLSEVLPKNVVISMGSTNPFSYNNTVELVCIEGYETNSSTSVTCQADRNWTPFPECEAISCGAFGETITNAETSQYNSNYGDNITVTCYTGYALEGSGIIQCGADRSWSNAPSCAPINCTQLSEILPKNVAISEGSTNHFSYNDTVELVCKEGYETDSSTTVTCQADGNWTPFPECEAVSCGPFGETIENAEISQDGGNYGDNITVTCYTGYALEGSGIIQCGADRSWSNAPSCAPINCTQLSEILPKNVAVSVGSTNPFSYNDTVELVCKEGYETNSSISVTCLADGNWTPFPECEAVSCGHFRETIENAEMSQDGSNYGDNITVTCYTGYALDGSGIIQCGADRSWSNAPTCGPINCTQLSEILPKNVAIFVGSTNPFSYNDTVELVCKEGYETNSSTTVTCQADGNWTPFPECEAVSCGAFGETIENAEMSQDGSNYGDNITVTCYTGYALDGSGIIQCGADRSWSNAPTCGPINCTQLSEILPKNVAISVRSINPFSYNVTVELVCKEGYETNSSTSVTCQADGNWTPFPECEAVSCGAFGETIMNAETSQYNNSYGDNITVTCYTGYALEGSGSIQCGADKSWSDAPSCAPINCTHLSEEILPENLAISEGSANLFHYNITVDLACGVGYIINGTRSVTCQANGTWTNLPKCNAIKCVKFIPPEFGDIDKSFYVGQYLKENVTIKCQDGFKIEDPTISTAECQSNGTWTTRVKCVKINCGEHEQVTNGNLDGSDDDFNSTITISCDPGYALPGPNISTCQANKTWSEIGQCLPITCTNFDVVENSQNRSTIRDIKYGEDIDILCNDGFVYVGKKPLTCYANGDWPVVNCSRVTCNGSTGIDHGSVVNTNETALEFKCQDGYESLSGLIVQCIDGEWGTLPNCTKVDCGQIQDIDNGSVIYINKTTLFGDTAVVNCSYGYEPLETQEITCQSNGSWSHYQTCALIRCPSVLGSNIYIANSTANYSFEDSATVACAAGYTLDGSNVIECKADGNWTDIPTCSLINCSSPIIANGNVTFNTTSNGSTATVICEYGYMHDGNGSALCENGTWLGIGSCETIACNPFMPQKNMRTQNDSNGEIYPFNSVIQVECDEGYQFTTNDTTLTCDLTGNWTVLPECEKIMCTIQNVSNGRPNPDKVMFLIGELYNLTCDEGYDLLDESNVTCDENGMWNKQLSCEPVNCTGDISLENGTFSPSKLFYSYGNEVSINCNEGFKVEGSSEIQCLANGSWSHLPSCTLITCGNISVSENAEIVDDGGNTFGSNTTIKCKPGFYLTGINTSMCMDDENWLELGNCSLIECGTIPLINNTRNISANFTRQYNSSISYECDEGYNFSNESDAQIVCSQNGMWEGSITCQKVKCLKLNIGNGSISDETNEFGDIVQVQCNDNYTLTGNSEVRCLANGSWDDVPICEKVVVCPTLTIRNGNINFTDGLANVTCFDLYSLNGSSNVDCQQNGSWTEIPRCDLAFCQPLTIDNGYINGTQTEIGSVVYVSCKAGYKVNGTAITTCEADGNWSAEVVCELMSCISFDVNEGVLFTVDNKTAPFNGSIIPTCIPGTVFTPGSVREINCTENGWIGAPECEIQGQISFEQYTYSFPSGQEAVIKCIISNNPNWQHAVMKKMNQTIFSVWNDTGSVRVTDEISIHTYTAFHSLESTFEFGLNISSIICDDAGVYICELEAGNFTSVKSANASVSLTGTATIPNISAPEFMNAGHGGEIKCTGNIGFNENGLTGNLSLFVTTVEQSIPVSEINQQCDGYAEAVFMVPGFPNNITEVTVRCETSTVEGSPLVSSNRTIEIRSSYVAFPVSSYLLKIGQPGSIVCDVANIVNWTAVVISKPGDADFIEVFSNGTNNLQNGSNIDLSNSNLTDTAVKVVVNFNNVTCSDAAMESGTINYTCTARNGDAVLGQDTTKITFQRPPGLPILTMAERVYERSDSFGGQEFSCKGNVGSPPGEIYVESTFMDDSEIFQTFLTYDDTTKVDTSYGWVNVGPLNTTVACGVEVEIKFALREPPLSLHRKKLRCVIKPSTEIVNEESVYSDVGIIIVVPESVCESEAAQKKVEHPYTCHTFVQCSERKFAYAALTGCREDECYNESHTQACTNCTCQKRARTIDGFACEVTTIEVSLDNSANTACSLEGITTVNEIEITKDGQLYNLTSVGQSSFTGKLGKMDAQVDLTAKTASFSIVNVSCEDEGSYLIKIDSLSEEIIVEVSSLPKQPEISVPVSSYLNQEMTVQCMGYVGRKSQEAATRLQLQTHAADETEFIVYGVLPTNQSMECSDTTCECYETLFFSIFPTLSKNNSVVRCAALASDGSLVVSSEEKVLSLVQGDIYFSGEDVTTAIGRSISLQCVLLNGLGANGANVHFSPNNSVGDTELCVVSQSGVGNCTVDGIWAYATNIDSSVTVNVTIGNISCSNVGRYTCTSITTSASAASINLDAFELPTAPTLKLSRQIIDGQGTWGDRLFYCSGELGPEGALTIELTKNGTFLPLLTVNDTDNDVAFIRKDNIVQQTSTCNNEVTIPFAFKAAHVNSKLHGKRLRCKTSPLAGLGLDVLYSNEEEIKVVNSSFCLGKEDGYHSHPFHCNLYIQCDSNGISGMHSCQDNNCWDASDKQCKQCDQLAVVCQVEEINCFPEQVPVYNGTRPGDVYCSLVNVEQIHILNISKNGNLLRSIPSPLGIHNFGQFIRLSVNTDAINVTFGTASCEDEGEYSIELSNETRTEFFVWVVSNAEMPILNVISPPKLNQNLKMTCTAMLGRGLGRTERTQVVLQRRKNGEAFEEYEATHMSDCTTSPCVCFVEAEYSVLLTDSWNETDVRCALKNTSTNLIEEDLTSSISTLILGDTVSSEMSGDHQVVILTIESMGCIDESEYHCTAVKDPLTYASLRLEAQADPKELIISMPLTTVENIPTPYTTVDYLWCLANIGSDINRVVQIEIQKSSDSKFNALNLKTAETTGTTSENCEINVTITYKGIKFDNSYNNSKARCSVYQNSSSTDPIVFSQVYDVTLLPGGTL
ncbi:uncharacterized protein LOC128219502 [Mya arenaria]|uniref:uncharacterized protein LOC128219502 n=1 Tax=Mya arenaria TaxID=6604 RepID=UPI0022E6E146|nr:uncharacterized protein LOC128219502 [Mya arenaria]